MWDNQVWQGINIDRTYQVNNKVGVDVSIRSELTSKSESRLKSSGVNKSRPKWKSSWSRWVPMLVSRLRSKLVLRMRSKSIFELREYKLNYLFKYSKSVAECKNLYLNW